MKKSVLIGVLAALMLFAFTACENSAPTSPIFGKMVESINPVEYPDIVYAEGKEISKAVNTADILLEVVFDDGTKEEYTGMELGLKESTTKKVDGARVYEAKYGQSNSINVVIPTYTATLEGVDVSTAENKTVAMKAASKEISAKGLAYVYSYGNDKEIRVALPEKKLYLISDFGFDKSGVDIDWSKISVGDTFNFKLTEAGAGRLGINVDTPILGTWTVTIEAEEVKQIANLSASVTAPSTEYFVGGLLSDVGYTVKFTYDDKTYELTADTQDGWTRKIDNYTSTYRFEKAGTVNDIVVVVSNGTVTAETKLSVNVIDDYSATFTVTSLHETKLKAEKWTIGKTVGADNFKFEVNTWASNLNYSSLASSGVKAPTLTLTSDDFTALTTIKPGSANNDPVGPVRFSYKDAGTKTQVAVYTNNDLKVTVE